MTDSFVIVSTIVFGPSFSGLAIWSAIFHVRHFQTLLVSPSFSRSVIFRPCDLVRHFPGPSFSTPYCLVVRLFQVLHFQLTSWYCEPLLLKSTVSLLLCDDGQYMYSYIGLGTYFYPVSPIISPNFHQPNIFRIPTAR